MLYRTEHVKLHTLIHITTTSFHTLIHITSTSLTIESCIPRNFKLHPDPHNHKYWDLQIDRSASTKASYSGYQRTCSSTWVEGLNGVLPTTQVPFTYKNRMEYQVLAFFKKITTNIYMYRDIRKADGAKSNNR